MQITLEGRDRPVPVEAGDTILESLLRAGVAFPFSCQAGNCGTCKCELVSGDVHELEHSEHALSPEERAKGIILACRTQVWEDTVVRRIDAEDLVMHPSRVMRCRVLALDDLTHDIKGLRLAIGAGADRVDPAHAARRRASRPGEALLRRTQRARSLSRAVAEGSGVKTLQFQLSRRPLRAEGHAR